jgi:hypothetical protein
MRTINDGEGRHQLAFLTPGIRPLLARLRKQIRQMPNLRYTARGRPHSLQRFSRREENLGVRLALAILLLLATGWFPRQSDLKKLTLIRELDTLAGSSRKAA